MKRTPAEHQWQLVPEAQLATSVWGVAKRIESNLLWRRQMMLRNARVYQNMALSGFGFGEYGKPLVRGQDQQLTFNVTRSCVDTAAAKISKTKPRPLFLTDGGDWSLERRAKGMTAYLDALFDASKNYPAMQRQFLDAAVYGIGAKLWYIDDGEVKQERIAPNELLIDDDDARRGEPRQMHRARPVLADKLIEMFPKREDAILAAQQRPNGSVSPWVPTLESWHVSSSSEAENGRHCITLKDTVLHDEGWNWTWLPATFFRWADDLEGFWGTSLVDELYPMQMELNRVLRVIQQSQHYACVPRVYMDVGTQVARTLSNEIGEEVRYTGKMPQVMTASAQPAEIYQHAENVQNKMYSISAISQLSASSQKPAGLDSGVALREYKDTESERFALKSQRYEELSIADARIAIELTRILAKKGGAPKLLAMNGQSARAVDWKSADIEDSKYTLRCYPVNFLPAQPAGKLQFISELRAQFPNKFPEELAISLLEFPDLKQFTSMATAPVDSVKLHLELIIERGKMVRPTKLDNLELCKAMGHHAFLRGFADGIDKDRLELLGEWLDLVQAELEAQMPPPAPPPEMPMPGAEMMPPGAPPMAA